MFIRKHVFREGADDGSGGSSGNGGDGGAGGGAGSGGDDGAGGEGEAGKAGQIPSRPDFISEQFWDAEKGEVKAEALAKSQKDSRTELETLKSSHKAPDKAEAYQLPEGVDVKDDDKVIALARVSAHKAGMSQTQFEAFVGSFTPEALKQSLFAPPEIDQAEELKKIGPNGDAMFKAVEGWGNALVSEGVLSADEFTEVFQMNATAEGIQAINKMREYFGGNRIPANSDQMDGATSQEDWYNQTMHTKDESGGLKYQTDPVWRAKMDKEAERIFGTGPAHSSKPSIGMK